MLARLMASASSSPMYCPTHVSRLYWMPSGRSVNPKPAISGAITRSRCDRSGMVRRQFAHALTPGPEPWTRTTTSPDPWSW